MQSKSQIECDIQLNDDDLSAPGRLNKFQEFNQDLNKHWVKITKKREILNKMLIISIHKSQGPSHMEGNLFHMFAKIANFIFI